MEKQYWNSDDMQDVMELDSIVEGSDPYEELSLSRDMEDENEDDLYNLEAAATAAIEAESQKSGKVKQERNSEDDYLAMFGSLPAHHRLPQNAHPTQAQLQSIYDRIHYGSEAEQKQAKTEMLGILSSYILSLVSSKYGTYAQHHREELMQQGYLGAMKGMNGYDPSKGAAITWFRIYIEHEIQEYINGMHHSTPYYTTATKLVSQFIERKKRNNEPYNEQDIMIETGLSLKTINKVIQVKNTSSVPMDAGAGYDIKSEREQPEEAVIRMERTQYLHNLLQAPHVLDPDEKICLMLRYGVDDDDPEIQVKYFALCEKEKREEEFLRRAMQNAATKVERESIKTKYSDFVTAGRSASDDDKNRSYARVTHLAQELYGLNLPKHEVSKKIPRALAKLKSEADRRKRAQACHRIRVNIESNIAGEIINKTTMMQDRDAVAAYFDTGIFVV